MELKLKKLLNYNPWLRDDTTFAILIEISPHMVVMVNEINNLIGLNAIL
jgi:hypothetical protein